MDEGLFDDETDGPESGGKLRQKLEAEIQARRKVEQELVSLKAKDLIQAKGLKYVTPEDLSGTNLNQLEVKALEVEQAKAEQRRALLRDVLSAKGYEDAELDTAVEAFLGESSEPAPQTVPLSQLGRIQGTAPQPVETKNLFGVDKIRAGILATAKK